MHSLLRPQSARDVFDDVEVPEDDQDEELISSDEKTAFREMGNPQGEMPLPGFEPRHRNALIGREAFNSEDEWLDELARNAIEISRLWGYSFWNGNRNLYSVSGLSWEDLSSVIYDRVWQQRFLPRLTSGQMGGTIKDFRSQFYIGCQMNCWIHRRYLLAKKRYWEEGQVYSLSNSGKSDDGEVDVTGDQATSSKRQARRGKMRPGNIADRRRLGVDPSYVFLEVSVDDDERRKRQEDIASGAIPEPTDEEKEKEREREKKEGVELIAIARNKRGDVIHYYTDEYVRKLASSGVTPSDAITLNSINSNVTIDFLRRSSEMCNQMSLTAVRAHLLVLFKPRQYPTIAALARRFRMSTVKLQQLIEAGTNAANVNASRSNYGLIVSDCTYTTPTMSPKLDKEALRAVVNSALHSGAIRRKSPGEQAAELIPTMPEAVQRVVYDLICAVNEGKPLSSLVSSLSTGSSDQRVAQFGARMVANLDIDYEILNAALGVEINPEINPMVAWRVISNRLSAMSEADRTSVIEHPHLGKLIEAIKHCSSGAGVVQFTGKPVVATPLFGDEDEEEVLEPIIASRPRNSIAFIATRVDNQSFNFIPISRAMREVWGDIKGLVNQIYADEDDARNNTADKIHIPVLGVHVQYPGPSRKIKGAQIKGEILEGLTTMQVQRMLNSWFNLDD